MSCNNSWADSNSSVHPDGCIPFYSTNNGYIIKMLKTKRDRFFRRRRRCVGRPFFYLLIIFFTHLDYGVFAHSHFTREGIGAQEIHALIGCVAKRHQYVAMLMHKLREHFFRNTCICIYTVATTMQANGRYFYRLSSRSHFLVTPAR